MASICPKCKFLIICDALHKDSIIECEDFENKQKTNADRIRAMTDEELAEWIGEVTAGGYGMCAPGHYDCTGKDSCAPCWLDWLKQEAEE